VVLDHPTETAGSEQRESNEVRPTHDVWRPFGGFH